MANRGSQDKSSKKSETQLEKRRNTIQVRLEQAREALAKAEEGLQRAEVRLQKRASRVKELETILDRGQQKLAVAPATEPVVVSYRAQTEEAWPEVQPSQDALVAHISVEALATARQARAVASTAERAARLAIKRALDASVRMEQMVFARHLEQELQQLQDEADKAGAFAQETEQSASTAEQLVTVLENLMPADEQPLVERLPASRSGPGSASSAEIDEEEEAVEKLASMVLANAAGVVAAEAEARAEASSLRAREARQLLRQAEQMVMLVRSAIQDGALLGAEAVQALQAAEREATHAQAVLADAEAAEEQALHVAMYAEADAEVAEGMAFAADQHWEEDNRRNNAIAASSHETTSEHPVEETAVAKEATQVEETASGKRNEDSLSESAIDPGEAM